MLGGGEGANSEGVHFLGPFMRVTLGRVGGYALKAMRQVIAQGFKFALGIP